jgi:F-type H+/Na+-transporting ATPase subunit alpha
VETLPDEAKRWLGTAPRVLADLQLRARVDHIGSVTRIGDGVASITGLPATRLNELVRFDDGTLGLALQVREAAIETVLLGSGSRILAGSTVRGTGEVARVPVGAALLGRILDPLGAPLDGGPAVEGERYEPVERPAPGILDRDLITEPLMTGITIVDGMIPLGRGQRQLLIGDRKTGKTALAVDTIINQRETDIICVYAMIGQKASTVEQIINSVRTHGSIGRCIFVVGEASSSPGAQWITPYAACTMAEYFRDKGQHALLVLDDLTKHAIAYRELSLLLRRPSGREAYPGDIFYIHSRLLERAGKLSSRLGGGSLTALPIAETQAGNLSAYIPTNLISITDGQIYFEPKLFYEGQKPAVNVGMSVSRVGSKTQAPIIKEAAESLKLKYAQFLELEVFTRFGAMVDERTRSRIEHGRSIRAILVQSQFQPRTVGEQAALLMAVKAGKLDRVALADVVRFKSGLGSWLSRSCPELLACIAMQGSLAEHEQLQLLASLDRFIASFEGRSVQGA